MYVCICMHTHACAPTRAFQIWRKRPQQYCLVSTLIDKFRNVSWFVIIYNSCSPPPPPPLHPTPKVCVSFDIFYYYFIDRFYIAQFSALEQTHCARMWFCLRFICCVLCDQVEGEGGQVGEEEEEGESLIRPCQQRSVWATVPAQGRAQPTTTPATKMETGPCLKRMKITVRTPIASPFFSPLRVSLFCRLLSLFCFVLRSMFCFVLIFLVVYVCILCCWVISCLVCLWWRLMRNVYVRRCSDAKKTKKGVNTRLGSGVQ